MIQHRVIFSIGSNLGDRLAYLQKAVFAIHEQIGTVTQVSAVFETPPWGFVSTPFYNAVLVVHTFKEPQQILSLFLSIEESLGRKRSKDTGYQARTIDIDLIAYDELLLDSELLTIPHPFMHQRKFVLVPMLDLEWEWKHPVYHKSIEELLLLCPDDALVKKVDILKKPLDAFDFSRLHFLAIEGNIGAGKTTLAQKIAEDFTAKSLLEGFADNPFLPKFYKNPARYALPLEMSFLADRYSQLSDDVNQPDLFSPFIVSDYYLFKSLIFAQVTLEADEFRLYKNIFDIMHHQAQKPDLYVYLHQSTDQLLKNIQKRGRSYETDIQASYLTNINKGYYEFMKTLPPENVLIIDMTEKDFVYNPTDYLFILDAIQSKINQT